MTNLQRFNIQVLKAINEGGITLGLGEKNFLKTCNYKQGYQVGGFSREIIIDVNKIENFNNEWINFYYEVLALTPNFYENGLNLGLWVDNGLLYIEISKRFLSKKQAIKEAIEKNQKAIWDWKNTQELKMEGLQ